MVSLDVFQNPDPSFRGTDLWMLNGELDGDELRRQIAEMKAQGFYSFIARTYIGHKSDYPGPEFMQKMRVIVDEAKRQDMKVFVQAGYMPGGVLGLPEEYTHSVIRKVDPNDQSGPGANSDGEIPPSADRNAPHGFRIDKKQYCLDMLNVEAMRFYLKTSYEDMWADFRDDFGATITSIWVDEPHFSPPDFPWTDQLPQVFGDSWGYDIWNHVGSLFADVDDYQRVRYHYWRTVLKLLKEAYFTEVAKWCRHNKLLFSGHLMGEDTLTAQIAWTGSAMPLYKYFDIPGIDHLTADLGWKHGHKKGTAEHNYLFLNTPLQCSSAAHQAGKEKKLCEMYGVSTQHLTLEKQRYIFDHFASLGINHKCVHGLFYTLKGRGKRAYPPHVAYYQPYWSSYRALTDYQARTSWFLSQGKPAADVLYIHPIEQAFMEYRGPEQDGGINSYGALDREFNFTLRTLVGAQISFELGDEDTIADTGRVTDAGDLAIGEMSYGTVVLPNLTVLRATTLTLLEQFSQAGGQVIVMGTPPTRLDGVLDDAVAERLSRLPGVHSIADYHQLRDHLSGRKDRKYVYVGEGHSTIQIAYREDGDDRYLFVFNADQTSGRQGYLELPGRYTVFRLDGLTGHSEEIGAACAEGITRVPIALEAGSSVMLHMQGGAPAAIAATTDVVSTATTPIFTQDLPQVCELTGPWCVRPEAPNALLLEYCCYKTEKGQMTDLLPILGVQHKLTEDGYRGPLTLRFPLTVKRRPNDAQLALEDPSMQQIRLNGVPVDTQTTQGYFADRSFQLVSLPDAFVEGRNVLEVVRDFEPLEVPTSHYTALFQRLGGVELEAMYIIGDFGVYGTEEPTDVNCLRYNREFVVDEWPELVESELTGSGFPFFAGAVTLHKDVRLDTVPENRRAFLTFDRMNACVTEVTVNQQTAGQVFWKPYRLEITGLLAPGTNTIALTLTNTLRNLLGPYHRPVGEPKYCWSGYSTPDHPWLGAYSEETGEVFTDWYFRRFPETSAWTDSYLQVPFGVCGTKLVFV